MKTKAWSPPTNVLKRLLVNGKIQEVVAGISHHKSIRLWTDKRQDLAKWFEEWNSTGQPYIYDQSNTVTEKNLTYD